MKITLAHGSGGKSTTDLISQIFAKHFSNPLLDRMEDAAVLPSITGRIAVSTDSFVVTPLVFPGGDIGKLAICGSVNDVVTSGAIPQYLTCGFILETGLDTDMLERIVESMAETAKEAGVQIVAGDTKVIEGNGGVYINTTGIGIIPDGREISIYHCSPGDSILITGTLGDHHAAILSDRMKIENNIQSDCAVLSHMVQTLYEKNIQVKAMRDVTRGGLGTILNEISQASNVSIVIEEKELPVSEQVKAFCGILGLDPMFMGNEGNMVVIVSEGDKEKALDVIRSTKTGGNAKIIGKVEEGNKVILKTPIGGKRIVGVLKGEGLPRIC